MKTYKTYLIKTLCLGLALLGQHLVQAQQEPQYTQYQYNTMTVNPAYTGTQGYPSVVVLYRDQWLGLEGSPTNISLGIDTPFGTFNGIGLSIVQDEIGPAEETFFDVNYAHSIVLNRYGSRLAFGLKAGGRMLNVDWTKGSYRDIDPQFQENINNDLAPVIGAGVYYYTSNAYVGLATPNFLTEKTFDIVKERVEQDRVHLYFIAGYVFDLNRDIKFKPSTFIKEVKGSPLSVDLSANFLFYEKLTLGANYRWDDSFGGMIGFKVSSRFDLGYAYDATVSDLNEHHNGTHEVFVRYSFISPANRARSPRFF